MTRATPPSAVAAPPALKEWALVCDRLLDGRQAVLFRKGGIDEKGFWVEAPEFLLFPTFFHQMRDKVRPEFRREFDDSMRGAPPEGVVRFTGHAAVVDAIEVRRPEGVGSLEDLHPYTPEQVAMRLEFRPRKPLAILVVRARPLARPIEAPAREEFAGCLSWVEPGIVPPPLGEPALPGEALEAVARRVRAAVG